MDIRNVLHRHRFHLLGEIAIVALILLTYAPSLRNGFALLDDGLLIYENNAVREMTPSTLKAIFTSYDPELYIPLTLVSYQIDHFIGGFNPVIYHITNMLLHTANALLVFSFASFFLRRTWAALIIAILFALHPLHVETVAWASARKDLLSAFFFLAAFAIYVHYTRTAAGSPRIIPYVASLVLFALGLLAKGTILVLPLVLLLSDYIQKRSPRKDILLEKVPFFFLSVFFGFVALGGKQETLAATTFFEKALLSAKTTLFFLLKFLFPQHLTVSYPQLSPITLSSIEFLVPVILLILLLSCVLLLIRHAATPFAVPLSNETGRRMVFCVLFSLLTLAPSYAAISKGISIYVFADRYGYLPSIGLLLLLGMGMVTLIETSEDIYTLRRRRNALFVAISILILLFCRLTIRQSLLWGDWGAFMEKTTQHSPNFYRPYIDLGASYRIAKKPEEAIQSYRKALELYELPNIYGLIGQVYAEQGEFEKAVEEFQRGILLNTGDTELHHGLGQVYALQGKKDEALAEYERALSLMAEPETPYEKLSRRIAERRDMVLLRIGILYGEQGDHAKAIKYYEQALEENPFFADAHFNLAVGLGNLGKKEEAIMHYEEAVRLEPTHIRARVNLAMMYAKRGKLPEAKKLLQDVLREDPKNTVAKNALEQLKHMR